jgi:L-rhamnose isomerase/sugar isomerase
MTHPFGYDPSMLTALPARVEARLGRLAIELPSWGFADTGTRFGKFLQDAAALTVEDKLDDVAEVHRLTGACPSMAIHALWDMPGGGAGELAALARARGLRIGSINPNLFQDQCYKHGSVANEDASIRRRAIGHMLDCVEIGRAVGSDSLVLWFADGTNYPGQGSVARRKRWFTDALREVHAAMPPSMRMLLEYKPFEPAFYHTDIADWGMAHVLAKSAGERARVLVDTGHHLPGQNVEQIVSFLADEGMLGGFHFNDRHYADDDLTMGSIDPYRVFRIVLAICEAERALGHDLPVEFMIDQSHNLKPKVEAMVQTVMTAQEQFAKAMLVDLDELDVARASHDIVAAEECLKRAFATDVRDALARWRTSRGLPADPLAAHRASPYAARAAAARAPRKARSGGSYA